MTSARKNLVQVKAPRVAIFALASLYFLALHYVSHLISPRLVPNTVNQPPAPQPVSVRPVRYCDKHHQVDFGPCIFDIGLNTGQDTKLYLDSSSTARVVAVEAAPTLVDKAKTKFAPAIQAGRLKLLGVGLVGNATESKHRRPKLTFWVNKYNNKFSSFKQVSGCRTRGGQFLPEGNTTFCTKIEMETISCSELVEKYGTPIYMKIDIEGMDRPCLESLGNIPLQDRPIYASKENVFEYDVRVFTQLGYTKFKVVNQAALQAGLEGDEKGHSGPWGEDAEDIWIGKKWHSRQELLDRLPVPKTTVVQGIEVKGWYDLHGKR